MNNRAMSATPEPGSQPAEATHNAAMMEWAAIVAHASESAQALVAGIVKRDAAQIAEHFYDVMQSNAQSAHFLENQIAHRRLHASMMQWLQMVFAQPGEAQLRLSALVAMQLQVGETHARIHLPTFLMVRGFRLLGTDISERITQATADLSLQLQASSYVRELLSFAMELMGGGFQRFADRSVRSDEAFRQLSLGENLSVEREKQRAALGDWVQSLLFLIHRRPALDALPRLAASEFGLWFNHKARNMFEGMLEIDQIAMQIEHIDNSLLPLLGLADATSSFALLTQLESELANLRFLMSSVFDQHVEIESGRDVLTRLLNRRFVESVLGREIRLAKSRKTSFALLLVDLDHFKLVNDRHGHNGGDLVLQQAAALLLNNVRNGDFVFRYGGEEFLLVLVEVDKTIGARIAETIRAHFESSRFLLEQNHSIQVTASIGLAMFDGHPDHRHLVRRADEAMYQAKRQGRNRVVSVD